MIRYVPIYESLVGRPLLANCPQIHHLLLEMMTRRHARACGLQSDRDYLEGHWWSRYRKSIGIGAQLKSCLYS